MPVRKVASQFMLSTAEVCIFLHEDWTTSDRQLASRFAMTAETIYDRRCIRFIDRQESSRSMQLGSPSLHAPSIASAKSGSLQDLGKHPRNIWSILHSPDVTSNTLPTSSLSCHGHFKSYGQRRYGKCEAMTMLKALKAEDKYL